MKLTLPEEGDCLFSDFDSPVNMFNKSSIDFKLSSTRGSIGFAKINDSLLSQK